MSASRATALKKITASPRSLPQPRLGFIGTGWIGRLRMEALRDAGAAQLHCVYDPSHDAATTAATIAGGISIAESIAALIPMDVDGVVIAAPRAMHADHCIKALGSGKAVFCQKPLARTSAETRCVVEAARAAN